MNRPINVEMVPRKLCELPRWVAWKWEMRDGKPDKPLYVADEPTQHAKVNDPSTWRPFQTAVETVRAGRASGQGFVLGDGIGGIDLDDCRDPKTGIITDWAMAIINDFASYTEVSPSSTGVKIFVGLDSTVPSKGLSFRRPDGSKIEMFSTSKFFTVTGEHLPTMPRTIEPRTAEFAALHARLTAERTAKSNRNARQVITSHNPHLDDATIIDKAMAAKNGSTFTALWNGDTSLHSEDDSLADLALCSHLAFWTGCDAGTMDRLFRQSGLMRQKWDSQRGSDTYGSITIVKAIASCTNVYSPLSKILDKPAGGTTVPTPSASLADVHATFRRWLGPEYDLDAINATLAATVIAKLDGDPAWLLLVSGSGNAKTETVQSLSGTGAHITSTITSDGALLSGSPKKERATDATGGLLRKIGESGVLVIKDVTSILSMNRDTRGSVLAALREVHDGRWERNIGTDGGRTLSWSGRVVVIGAVTTAWDRAHDVIASMGDRFVTLRMDSTVGRMPAGRRAVANTSNEKTMRAELSAVVAGVLASVDLSIAGRLTVTDAERDRILAAADVVTLARTGVDYDYRGDVIDAHAPEMPTRFAKQLAQVMRGGIALGMTRADALRLAIRCARDSMPPIRLAILDDVASHPGTPTKDVRRRLGKPRATVDRQLQSLHMLGVLSCDEEEGTHRGEDVTLWRYRLADGINPDVLNPIQCQKCQ